jgi:hypothetical protein
MGFKLYARWVNLKRMTNGMEPYPDGSAGLALLWRRQGEDGRSAWNALWVGLVRHGYDDKADRHG